tara:strand:+ start:730 stop:1788 length:1059 start_codon:yes stop_codon:yes gene_type:complete
MDSLTIKVGSSAFQEIRQHGFDTSKIKAIVGASGGPKWLMLSKIDRVILEKIIPKIDNSIHLIASSIGVWRFLCYPQQNPVAAIEEFEHEYIEQEFSTEGNKRKISNHLRSMLDLMCDDTGLESIIYHPYFRTHILTSKARHILKSEYNPILMLGLLGSMTANAFDRRLLRYFFSRGLFFDAREAPLIKNITEFPMHAIPLGKDNLKDAVIASSAIPIFMEGIKDIKRAPSGVYRDGGIIDYHMDFLSVDTDHYALYPHFFDYLKPGWFDKSLFWRNVQKRNLDRTIFICPSEQFIKKLPGAKVPDRSDFQNLSNIERIKRWHLVVKACDELAEDFNKVLDHELLPNIMESF